MSSPVRLRGAAVALLVVGVGAAPVARADAGAGGSAGASASAGGVAPPLAPSDAGRPAEKPPTSCTEHLPEGKAPPAMTEQLPARGTSGHAAVLEVVVTHGKGETVLPDGFHLQLGSDEMRVLEDAGFALPHPDGGAGPTLRHQTKGDRVETTVQIPIIPLPPEPGRHELTLPPLPVAVARASGELITLCTSPHAIVVEDPTANTPDAEPKPNPPPRRQLEEWTAAKHVAYASLIALLVGGVIAWLIGKWLRRPKPAPPPVPTRPPWEIAFEELHDIRQARLIEGRRYSEHFDRVSFTIRKYLGERYGFDGLESTTREILGVLRRVVPPVAAIAQIQQFLRHADLVKFARLTPTADECATALREGEEIVQHTVPAFLPPGSGEGWQAPGPATAPDDIPAPSPGAPPGGAA